MSGFDDVGQGDIAPVPMDVRSSENGGAQLRVTGSLGGGSQEQAPYPYFLGPVLPRKSAMQDNFRAGSTVDFGV